MTQATKPQCRYCDHWVPRKWMLDDGRRRVVYEELRCALSSNKEPESHCGILSLVTLYPRLRRFRAACLRLTLLKNGSSSGPRTSLITAMQTSYSLAIGWLFAFASLNP